MEMVEDRITALEQHAVALEERVRELEGRPRATHPQVPIAPPQTSAPPNRSHGEPSAVRPVPGARDPGHHGDPAPAKPPRDLEDVLGGSVLAWLGGIAVLAGLAFLLTIAISRGWLGEGARTVLAGLLSTALLTTGIHLREHRDRTDAALAATAVGIAGLFGTLLMAGAVYHLVPVDLAQAAAFAVGALATTLAIRWNAEPIGWLGLLGALWAPAALGALDHGGIAFLAIAYAASVRVLVWRRWTALAWAVFVTVVLQWTAWLDAANPAHGTASFMLAILGALTAALALGLERQRPAVSPHAVVMTLLNAALLTAFAAGDPALLGALAVAHLVVGLAATRAKGISRELALVLLALGAVIADLAVAVMADGLVVALAWGGVALAFAAWLGARRVPDDVYPLLGARPAGDWSPRVPAVARAIDRVLRPRTADWYLAATGLAVQLLLAVGHVLAIEAPLESLAGGSIGATGLLAVAAIGLIAFAGARLSRPELDVLALAAVAYATGLAADGLPVTLALAAEAAVLSLLSRRASLAFAALAATHALGVMADPSALVHGLEAPLEAATALAAVTVALASTRPGRRAVPFTLLYLASVLVVTAGGPEHTGQALLSVLWALCGVAALVYGLLADRRTVRLAALSLLAVTAAKVFLYDLAELDSLARVTSFIGLGLLLLLGAFVWQRVRPRALT